MRAGSIEQLAPPRELYENPKTRFAAEFFGQPRINIFEDGRSGIRPEHVRLGGGDGPTGATKDVVELVEPLGADTWVTVKSKLTGRWIDKEREPHSGDTVWVLADRARVVRF